MKTDRKKTAEYIYGELEELRDWLDDIKIEDQDSFDELTERQQESKRGEALQEEIDNLDTAICDLDDAVNLLIEYVENLDSDDEEDEDDTDEEEELREDDEAEVERGNPAELARKLSSNLQARTETFADNGLQILNITCSPLAEDDADLKVMVELSAVPGVSRYVGKKLYINLYDENGYLYLSKCGYLSEIKSDRETVLLTCCGCGDVLYKVASGRLYISM